MFNKYYQDELEFLHQMGAEFAEAYPEATNLLTARSYDPDVGRLIEGFAFIAARIRQKLDDELPELTHSLFGLLWPHYLRPVPSMTVIEFRPRPDVRTLQRIEPGVEIRSAPIDGTVCRFRTCYPVEVAPLRLIEAAYETPGAAAPHIRLRFQLLGGAKLEEIGLERLRLFLFGESFITSEVYLRLLTQVAATHVRVLSGETEVGHFTLRRDAIRSVGFGEDETLLPYPRRSFSGYRLLQEYFTLPQKFLFVDVCGLAPLAEHASEDGVFEIRFELKPGAGESLRLSPGNFRLFCSPAVNLFPHNSDPISVEHTRTEYRVRPSGDKIHHYEIFSIDRVSGIEGGTGRSLDYAPFYTFSHRGEGRSEGRGYYQERVKESPRPREDEESIETYQETRLRESLVDYGTDAYVTFVALDGSAATPVAETIMVELTCTNRHLPDQLHAGDLRHASDTAPQFATFENIIKPTETVRPPLDKSMHWRLISHMSLNYLSLMNVEALRGILELYNYQIHFDQQAARENRQRLEGLISLESRPVDTIWRGAPIRGRAIRMVMDEDKFAGEGDMYLFASILDEFFSLYASINAFTQLTVRGQQRGEEYKWPQRIGRHSIL